MCIQCTRCSYMQYVCYKVRLRWSASCLSENPYVCTPTIECVFARSHSKRTYTCMHVCAHITHIVHEKNVQRSARYNICSIACRPVAEMRSMYARGDDNNADDGIFSETRSRAHKNTNNVYLFETMPVVPPQPPPPPPPSSGSIISSQSHRISFRIDIGCIFVCTLVCIHIKYVQIYTHTHRQTCTNHSAVPTTAAAASSREDVQTPNRRRRRITRTAYLINLLHDDDGGGGDCGAEVAAAAQFN